MHELIVKRIEALGYTVQDSDIPALEFIENSTNQYIINFCNVDKLPLGLTYVYVNAVCGEFLYQKKSSGGLGDTFAYGKAVEAAIKSIQEGDVSVSFDNTLNPEAQFDTLLNAMRTIDTSSLIRYRKLVW